MAKPADLTGENLRARRQSAGFQSLATRVIALALSCGECRAADGAGPSGRLASLPVLLALVFSFAISSSVRAQSPVATVNVNTMKLGSTVPQDFVGLSLEVSSAGQGLAVPPTNRQMGKPSSHPGAIYAYSLGEPGAPNTVFYKFMRILGPGVLRLGGNSQDNTCWDPDVAPHPGWCKGTINPGLMKLYGDSARASGWKLILGINLKQDSPTWARREVAEGVEQYLPAKDLLGLEIGNEPDLYARDGARPDQFSAAEDARDFLGYLKAFRQNQDSQTYAAIGPATCCDWRNPHDLETFLDGVGPANLKLVTVHNYSATTCDNTAVTAAQLLSPELMDRFNSDAKALIVEAHQHRLPIALAETNSASCGGMKGVSNAFTSALWGLDLLFSSAQDGFTNVNFHISFRAGGSAYNPVDTIGWKDSSGHWHFSNTAEPLYYAMYMFARNASGKHLLPVEVKTNANIRAYAVSTCSGCAAEVFVINKDISAAGEVRVHSSEPMGAGSLLLLQAPSLGSLAPDVRYGGAQFDSSADLPAPRETDIKSESNGNFSFQLPIAAVALLTIRQAGQ
jgi:hypothetical protein